MKSYLKPDPHFCQGAQAAEPADHPVHRTAVFLVTAIFSVADMMLRTQTGRAAGKKSGSWHLEVTGITPEQAAQLVSQPDVVRVGAGAVFNENGESAYRLNGKRVVLYGADADYVRPEPCRSLCGHLPAGGKRSAAGQDRCTGAACGQRRHCNADTAQDPERKSPSRSPASAASTRIFTASSTAYRGCLPAAGSLCGPADCKRRGTAPDTL